MLPYAPNPNARYEGESFSDYKARLREQSKMKLQPRMLWPASNGAYKRAKHGELSPVTLPEAA